MTTLTPKEKAARAKREQDAAVAGDAAAAALKTALARVDLVLPSLRSAMPVNRAGFVELGGCNASLASRLAEVINVAAEALQGRAAEQ